MILNEKITDIDIQVRTFQILYVGLNSSKLNKQILRHDWGFVGGLKDYPLPEIKKTIEQYRDIYSSYTQDILKKYFLVENHRVPTYIGKNDNSFISDMNKMKEEVQSVANGGLNEIEVSCDDKSLIQKLHTIITTQWVNEISDFKFDIGPTLSVYDYKDKKNYNFDSKIKYDGGLEVTFITRKTLNGIKSKLNKKSVVSGYIPKSEFDEIVKDVSNWYKEQIEDFVKTSLSMQKSIEDEQKKKSQDLIDKNKPTVDSDETEIKNIPSKVPPKPTSDNGRYNTDLLPKDVVVGKMKYPVIFRDEINPILNGGYSKEVKSKYKSVVNRYNNIVKDTNRYARDVLESTYIMNCVEKYGCVWIWETSYLSDIKSKWVLYTPENRNWTYEVFDKPKDAIRTWGSYYSDQMKKFNKIEPEMNMVMELAKGNKVEIKEIKLLRDFLREWGDNCIEWYKRRYESYKKEYPIYKKKLEDLYARAKLAGFDKDSYKSWNKYNEYGEEEYELKNNFEKKYKSLNIYLSYSSNGEVKKFDENKMIKDVRQNELDTYDEFIDKAEYYCGEILDVVDPHMNDYGFDITFVGNKNKVHCHTVSAGGVFKQIWHLRTLWNVIK